MEAQFKVLTDEELKMILESPDKTEGLLFPDDVDDPFEDQISLEKEWHAIHFFLTGELERDGSIEGEAILGGQEIGSDLGYGPARLINPTNVKAIADALESVDFLEWANEYDENSENADKVYGGISKEPFALDHQNGLFRKLNKMYGDAAKNNQAVLAYLC